MASEVDAEPEAVREHQLAKDESIDCADATDDGEPGLLESATGDADRLECQSRAEDVARVMVATVASSTRESACAPS